MRGIEGAKQPHWVVNLAATVEKWLPLLPGNDSCQALAVKRSATNPRPLPTMLRTSVHGCHMWDHEIEWIDWAFEDAGRLPATTLAKRVRAKNRDFHSNGIRYRGHGYLERSTNPLRRFERALMWVQRGTDLSGHAATVLAWDIEQGGRRDPRWNELRLSAYRKKHRPRGERPRKLSIAKARAIRARHASGSSMRWLATEYGVSSPTIALVIRNCVYRELVAEPVAGDDAEQREP